MSVGITKTAERYKHLIRWQCFPYEVEFHEVDETDVFPKWRHMDNGIEEDDRDILSRIPLTFSTKWLKVIQHFFVHIEVEDRGGMTAPVFQPISIEEMGQGKEE